ncbi:unnamed protein product [Leuciscus chuanchicus]
MVSPLPGKYELLSESEGESLPQTRVSVTNELRASSELLMFQLGFDSEAFALVFAEDYRAKVLQGEAGRETLETVEKSLDKLIPGCSDDLSFNKEL